MGIAPLAQAQTGLSYGKEVPDSYSKRQDRFQEKLAQSKSPEGQRRIAEKMAANPESEFQSDALTYLALHGDASSIPSLLKAGKNYDLVSFVCYALGEIGSREGMDFMIEGLKHENENARGTCHAAISKNLPADFIWRYHYFDRPKDRDESIKQLLLWWNANRDNQNLFQKDEKSDLEMKKAEQDWELGQQYLQR